MNTVCRFNISNTITIAIQQIPLRHIRYFSSSIPEQTRSILQEALQPMTIARIAQPTQLPALYCTKHHQMYTSHHTSSKNR